MEQGSQLGARPTRRACEGKNSAPADGCFEHSPGASSPQLVSLFSPKFPHQESVLPRCGAWRMPHRLAQPQFFLQ